MTCLSRYAARAAKRSVIAATFAAAAVLGFSTAALTDSSNGKAGNVVVLQSRQVIPGQYIVVLHEDAGNPGAVASEMARSHGLGVRHVYSRALRGFSAAMSDRAVTALRRDPRVDYIEADQMMYAFGQDLPTGILRIFADENTNITITGYDDLRIDVDVAVIDTGIDFNHPDLNVVMRTDCTGNPNDFLFGVPITCTDFSGDDGNGHGTLVAGTIGALDNNFGVVGVAPGARLWAVKVLKNNGRGWLGDVIAGMDYVAANSDEIEVANMSLGGGASQVICAAVGGLVGAGVVLAVAAGNSGDDAVNYSPANCAQAITVSALADFDGLEGGAGDPTCRSDEDDTLANFSNYGSMIDIAAPGVCIRSTSPGGGYNTVSGTSMASPHVAGAAALLAASGTYSPAEISAKLAMEGNFDWVDDSGDVYFEPLLDVSNMDVFAPATDSAPFDNTPPEVVISSPTAIESPYTSGVSISFDGTATDDSDVGLEELLIWTWDSGLDNGPLNDEVAASSFEETLPDGSYTITASVTDGELATGSASVDITVGDLPELSIAEPHDEVGYSMSGGRFVDKHLSVTVLVVDSPDAGVAVPVPGVSVTIMMELDGGPFMPGTGTTDESGQVTFTLKNAPDGCYVTDVTNLDGIVPTTPDNGFPKNATCPPEV